MAIFPKKWSTTDNVLWYTATKSMPASAFVTDWIHRKDSKVPQVKQPKNEHLSDFEELFEI